MEKQVWAEVVTIGSELVLGQLVDTNASYIAGCLAEIGVGMAYHTTVGDDMDRMVEALETALKRCHIVITTGGIGPTEDDLTREAAAAVMDSPLELRADLLEYIEGLFQRMGYRMADNNRRQAYVPEAAEAIHNPYGTAPAFRMERNGHVLICLPGVPRETEPLIREEVLPWLKERFTPNGGVLINRVLKVCGVGESNIDAQIKDIIRSSENPVIGLQASPREIKVRLTARADNTAEAEKILDRGEERIREKIGDLIFGYGNDTLAGNTARMIEKQGMSLAVAEALTNGLVSAELGSRLGENGLAGGLILAQPRPGEELCRRLKNDFNADLALAVSGSPGGEGRCDVEIRVEGPNGEKRERLLSLGGPRRILMDRATTMTLFTLFTWLREKTKALEHAGEGIPRGLPRG